MANAPDLIHPFLSIRGQGPVLPEGLSLRAAAGPGAAPPDEERKKKVDGTDGYLASVSGDANDLAAQRWGIVTTNDDRGARLALLVARLAEHRGQEQGEAPHVYRVDPGMTAARAEDFLRGPYRDELDRDTARVPRYLLLLGDADGVSWELQQALSRHGAFPGRLAFDRDADYEAYVEKVLAWERACVPAREALYYVVRDGSSAVNAGLRGLMAPSFEAVARAGSAGAKIDRIDLSAGVLSSPADLESEAQVMLSRAAEARGGLLVSLSHGAGLEKGASIEERRAAQGALQVHQRRLLGAADVASGPFFEGGAWFFFACFGAGTPAGSVYRPWLRSLAAQGYAGRDLADKVLSSLPEPASPFVASLPKAALAASRGPLAVFSHVDLAWSWSFAPVAIAPGRMRTSPRHERFDALLLALLARRRFGAAHQELATAVASVGQNLLALYGDEATRGEGAAGGDEMPALHRACLWLEHHDLGAFVLLGDPAARLPSAANERPAQVLGAAAAPRVAASVSSGPGKEVLVAEEDVLACLAGKQDPEEFAPSVGRTADELRALVDAYREAGRRALAEVLGGRR